jgi:hypothetical protein
MGFVVPASPHQPPSPYSQTRSSPKSSTRNSRPKAHARGLTPTDTDPKTQAPTFTLRLASNPLVRIHRPRSSPRHRQSPGLLTSSSIRRKRTQRQNQAHSTASALSTEEWVPKREAPDCTASGSIASHQPDFRSAKATLPPGIKPNYNPQPRYRSGHRSNRSGSGSPSHQPISHLPSTGANRRSLRQHCYQRVAPPLATTAPNPKEQTKR